jgi:N-acetyl-alpha-D-muramate 1-phosphate uridylyltransferase
MPHEIQTAIVFAAGLGKRLRPYTDITPKPLLEIGDTTCFDKIVDALKNLGIQRIIANTHHLSYKFNRPDVTYIHEPVLLETGGGLRNILNTFDVKDEHILCLNGDIWFEDETFLEDFLMTHNPDASAHLLLLSEEQMLSGVFQADYGLKGKNLYHRSRGDALYVYGGVQILNTRSFQRFVAQDPIFSMRSYFDFCEHHQTLTGSPVVNLKWSDIGTVPVYEALKKAHESFMLYTTFKTEEDAYICVNKAVAEGLSYCVNIMQGGVTSVYDWRNAIHQESEVSVLFKTKNPGQLRSFLQKEHSYEEPAIYTWKVFI